MQEEIWTDKFASHGFPGAFVSVRDRLFLVHPLAELNGQLSRAPVDLTILRRQLAEYPGLMRELLKRCQQSFEESSVTTIDEAVLHLGVERIRTLLVTVVVHEFCRTRLSRSVSQRYLRQAKLTARFSQSLAQMTGYGWPERAYLAGFLHDVGKLLVLPSCDEAQGLTLLEAVPGPVAGDDSGPSGTDAGLLGEWLGINWGLADSLIEVMARHDHPQFARRDPQLANIVALAAWMAREQINRGPVEPAEGVLAGVLPGGDTPEFSRD